MNDLNSPFMREHIQIAMQERYEAAHGRPGEISLTVVVLAYVASAVRRAAAAVESWARGASDPVTHTGVPRRAH